MKTAPFRKSYGGGFVLDCPALELPEGQITAVIGANGSGKTTLSRVLAGIEPPDGGASPLPACRVGYMPQNSYAFRMNTERNIALGGGDAARAARLMERLQLTDLAKQRARRLSGGETAKMALARLLMGRYALLLLDEPCAAMDMESTLAAETLLADYCRETRSAVLLVTHSIPQARRLASRILFLCRGALAEQGPTEAVLTAPQSEETRRFLAFYGL